MKKLSLYFIGLLLIPAFFLTSCDRGDDPSDGGGTSVVTPKFTLLKEYMEQNSMDFNNILTNTSGEKFVVGAPAEADLATFLDTYYIMDIRSADSYDEHHIEGAVNVAFGDILTEAPNAGTKPILMVCYTGQTACYGTALLRMYGYPHTRALKWGMSGWNPLTDTWSSKIDTFANGHANWSESDTAPTVEIFSDPDIDNLSGLAGLTSGSDILAKRVETVVSEGFGAATVTSTTVINSPSDYFINNYFSEGDYSAFGHIDGAYRINPFLMSDDTYKGLDPDEQIVTYCYTGQTSAVLTACLRVLGYDAYSMLFGMNGMYNNNGAWTTNQWGGDSNPKNLPFEE